MCSLEHIHDSNPTPAIVCRIGTTSSTRSRCRLVSFGVIWSHPKSSRVVRSLPESLGGVRSLPESESESSGVVWSLAKSSGIVNSHPKSSGVRVVRKLSHPETESPRVFWSPRHLELSKVDRSRPKSVSVGVNWSRPDSR